MTIEDVLDDREPKARATLLTARGNIDPVEALREPRQMLRRDAWAVIDHGDRVAAGLPPKRGNVLRLNAHLSAAVAIFQRVLHEVLQDLKELVAVAPHDRRPGETSDLEAEAHLAGERVE